MPDPVPYRLPRTIVPERYDLTLTPDLGAASFAGQARIRVNVTEAVTEVVLNAVELDILTAEFVSSDGERLTSSVSYDEPEERATIALVGTAQPGSWELDMTFTGVLNDKLHGFYRSTFCDATGTDQVIATTQFEATDARRAFPCWDEPDFKATFAVTLIVDRDLTAISNGAVIEELDQGNGKRQVTFAETMPMSTYLVAFVVGHFEQTEPVVVDGVPIRIASIKGKGHLTDFGLEAAAHALHFLADYFGIAYPHDKIDHIAVPDFAFGAMENLGCVTYRETALLVDQAAASRLELDRVAQVVAHETAHMWFGDLVTMKWWNGIWLNEAFATFMELLTVDAFRPDWEVWVTFGIGRSAAMMTDGLTSTRPVEFAVGRPCEAEGMFDILTYQKGAAVLRMLEQYLGPEPFRQGISRYLTEHSYGNTETTDLWDAIEAASGEPARAVMDSWIYQGGYPLVSVGLSPDGEYLTLSQRRFLYRGDDSGELWQVPINLRLSADGQVKTARVLLTEESTEVAVPGPLDWVVVNAGAWGFYRVRYEESLLQRLRAVMHEQLSPLERLTLVSDTAASMLAGHSPVTDFLSLVEQLPAERDPDVWGAGLGPLGLMDRILSDADRPLLQAFVRRITRPLLDELGWDPAPGEPERTGTLRARLLSVVGTLGADPGVRDEARSRLELYFANPATLAPDLVTAVVTIVAYAGGEDEYQLMYERFGAAATPQDQVRFLYALAAPQVPELLSRTLELCLTNEVRTQDAPYVIGSVLASRGGARLAWPFIQQHWDTIRSRFPGNSIPRMLEAMSSVTDAALARAIHAFLDEHPVPQETLVAQSLEKLDNSVAFADRVAPDLPAALQQR
ncbi:MAG: tricorn protease interacting factor [Acidimicrobiaceae bacterium]|nr:tricorn protease interacting factor [Acidimicrobiaceae bacterium]